MFKIFTFIGKYGKELDATVQGRRGLEGMTKDSWRKGMWRKGMWRKGTWSIMSETYLMWNLINAVLDALAGRTPDEFDWEEVCIRHLCAYKYYFESRELKQIYQ